jgi:hypothetical protein
MGLLKKAIIGAPSSSLAPSPVHQSRFICYCYLAARGLLNVSRAESKRSAQPLARKILTDLLEASIFAGEKM